MINFRQILFGKLKLSGIRGCMAAGAMTAGIAALAVIGGVNSEDISTVSLETDVIPEETVTEAETEKRTYSHDIEYLSSEDMKSMLSAENDTDEAEEALFDNEENTEADAAEASESEETPSEAETEAYCEDEAADETETSADETTAFAIEENESAPEVNEEAEEPNYEEAGETASESEADAELQTEETEAQETSESVSARTSAAGGDDDNSGLSSALDIETVGSTEADTSEEAASSAEEEYSAEEISSKEEKVPVEVAPPMTHVEISETVGTSDVPEDITIENETEEEVKAKSSGPQEGAISLFDLPEWLEFDENGVPTDYVKVLTGKACAYTASPDALMSTGKTVFQGYVAVDPDIIPYGTELYIVAEDGDVYGYAIAADTGYSVRKGHIIVDLFMNEYDDCIQWGNKPVNIYVLN